MKPHVTMLMQTSLDGRLHPSRWTASPDGTARQWSAAYERVHEVLGVDAWIVGRVTMAEMSKAEPHPPAAVGAVARDVHVAGGARGIFAIALDPSGRLHFADGAVGGDPALVLLGAGVADSHLAELRDDGVSYVVSGGETIDLEAALHTLGERFGIRRLALEGGGGINGSFLAAGLVDEISLLVAPALDGAPDAQGIVAVAGGLAGRVELSLKAVEMIDHGIAHLRYAVARSAAA